MSRSTSPQNQNTSQEDPRTGAGASAASMPRADASCREPTSHVAEPLRLPEKPDGYTPSDSPTDGCSHLAKMIRDNQETPYFLDRLTKVAQGDGARVSLLWKACERILKEDPPERSFKIVVDVVKAVARTCQRTRGAPIEPPPKHVTAVFLKEFAHNPNGVQQACHKLGINILQVTAEPHTLQAFDGKTILAIVRHLDESVPDTDLGSLETILHHAALQREGASLKICTFIRDKIKQSRGWIGKERQYEALWRVRDTVTRTLLDSPFASEANFKLALLYEKDIPHPGLDRPLQALQEDERWILEDPTALRDAFGEEHAKRILSNTLSRPLSSGTFIYIPCTPHTTIRGVSGAASKSQSLENTLHVVAQALNLQRNDDGSVTPVAQHTKERPPRTWISRSDELRFNQAQIITALKYLFEQFWGAQIPGRLREFAGELIRGIVRYHPYGLAMAAPIVVKFGPIFARDIGRIVKDEFMATRDRLSQLEGERPEIQQLTVVAAACRVRDVEIDAVVVDEIARVLSQPDARRIREPEFEALMEALRYFCITTTSIEAQARSLMTKHPETKAASLLARYLFEVRDPDPSLREIVYQQAMRRDLDPLVWICYAHAAVGLEIHKDHAADIRQVFESQYWSRVEQIACWNAPLREMYRIVHSSLHPERIGEISTMSGPHKRLTQSALEQRIIDNLRRIDGVTISQDAYISWAPGIDGVLTSSKYPNISIILLVDGEKYHSVNSAWTFRGFDGHSLLTKRILTSKGYAIIRISPQFELEENRDILNESVELILREYSEGHAPSSEVVVTNPPDDYTDIRGKVLFYWDGFGASPTREEGGESIRA
jgi:hypothetical protein